MDRIDPKTTATLRFEMADAAGNLIANATGSAVIYGPTGAAIASGVTIVNVGGGVYDLTVLAGWSTNGHGHAIVGQFAALATFTTGALSVTMRKQYLVRYADI